jgi:hypothetical protein
VLGRLKAENRSVVLDPAKAAPMLVELAGNIGDGAMPTVIGWRGRGEASRARADYPNGWSITLNFARTGVKINGQSALTSWTATWRGVVKERPRPMDER